MIIAGPDSSPLTPRKSEQHQTLVLATRCDIGRLSSGYLNWPRPSAIRPASPWPALRYWKANQAPLGSQTPVSESSHTLPPSDITSTALRAKSLGTDACRSAVEYFAFCTGLGGRPPDLRRQFSRPQALDALPSSLMGMRGMSRGIRGGHQPLPTIANLRKLTRFRWILPARVEGNCGHDQHWRALLRPKSSQVIRSRRDQGKEHFRP